jgi:hypothetical protein
MAIELSDDEKQKLKDLKDLLKFGQEQVTSMNVGWHQMKRRKQILSQMFAAVHSQIESISILLDGGRTFSVEILLRPVQETLINANYILAGRNNNTANRFLVGSNHKLIGQINKMIKYLQSNPHYNSGSPMLTVAPLQEALKKREKENKAYLRRFPYRILLKEPSVEERVMEIDKEYLRLKHKPPLIAQQWMYLTQYWLLSEQVHLSARGLLNYTVVTDQGVTLLLDGDKKDIDKYIVISSAMYLEMLYILNFQFKIPPKKELATWRKRIKANSKSTFS